MMPPPLPAPSLSSPAGFWKRYVAYFIDCLLVSMALQIVTAIPGALLGIYLQGYLQDLERRHADINDPALWWELGSLLGWLMLASLLLYALLAWLYFAKMESSTWQATLGKRLLGIVATDAQGGRLGFGQASARFLASALSWLTLNLGHALAAWRQDKRALHDLLAGTHVLNADPANAAMPTWGWLVVALHGVLFLATAVIVLAGIALVAANAGELGLLGR